MGHSSNALEVPRPTPFAARRRERKSGIFRYHHTAPTTKPTRGDLPEENLKTLGKIEKEPITNRNPENTLDEIKGRPDEPEEESGESTDLPIEIVDAETCNDSIYLYHRFKTRRAELETESDWYRMIEDGKLDRLYDSLLRKQQEKSPILEGILTKSSSVLHMAAWNAPSSLMLLLLEVLTSDPTSISRTKKYLVSGDADGNTPLHLACASLDSTKDTQITTPNGNIVAPSSDAIDFSVIKNLLLLSPETLDLVNNDDDTPLHLMVASEAFRRNDRNVAVEAAAEEAIASLLNMARHLAVAQNDAGCTLLHVALANQCHERVLVQILTIAPESINVADQRGMLPLHYVAAFGGTPWNIANYLVEVSPDTICCQTESGDTPLHLLMMYAKGIVKERWEHHEAVTPYIDMQQSLYHVDRQTAKLAELLAGTGAGEDCSPLLVQNTEDMTPLHCAAAFDAPVELTRILMNHGKSELVARASSLAIEQTGSTALHLAVLEMGSKKASGGVEYSTQQQKNARANIKALATPIACSIFDANDRTPLMLAVQQNKVSSDVLKSLIEALPESVSARTHKKVLPIHFACRNRKMKRSIVKGRCKESSSSVLLPLYFGARYRTSC